MPDRHCHVALVAVRVSLCAIFMGSGAHSWGTDAFAVFGFLVETGYLGDAPLGYASGVSKYHTEQ